MEKKVNIHEAKTHFSKLLSEVRMGRCVVIASNGQPVARLVPYEAHSSEPRQPGSAKEKIKIGDDFEAPLPEEILSAFEK